MFLQYVDFTIETKNRTTVLQLHVNNNKFLINIFLSFGIYHIFSKDVKGFCQPCFCFDRKRILFWEREHCSVSHTHIINGDDKNTTGMNVNKKDIQ